MEKKISSGIDFHSISNSWSIDWPLELVHLYSSSSSSQTIVRWSNILGSLPFRLFAEHDSGGASKGNVGRGPIYICMYSHPKVKDILLKVIVNMGKLKLFYLIKSLICFIMTFFSFYVAIIFNNEDNQN